MKISPDEIKEFIVKHYQYFGVGILFIILVVVLLIFSNGKKDDVTQVNPVETVSGSTSSSAIPVPETELQVDAYADVNQLVTDYFNAMSSGDVDKLTAICSELDDMEKIRIKKKAEYTEGYQNFTCYTKPGPVPDSYIVFAYYEMKFKDIDTLAPGLTSLYICKNDAGSLYIYDGELEESVNSYIRSIASQDDVVELLNKVDTKYSEAAAADEKLKAFMEELPAILDTAVSTELAAMQAAADAAAVSANEPQVEETAPVVAEIVIATDSVNIRKSASEEGDKVGKAAKGDSFTRLETMDNGWSKISFDGAEAYIKTEFLSAAGGTETEATEEPEQEADTQEVDANSDQVTIKETVNIRGSASETGEKLGVAYKGEKFDLIMKQADGWCKIKYQDKTAYVKSEYVE